jgi:hypothetical protein
MKFLTPVQARNAYNKGIILENRHSQNYVIAFSLCGLHFSSTSKRAKKGKHYKLDNPYWCVHDNGIYKKIHMILSGCVHLIKRKR